jgi:hypothetical protein
MIIVAHRLSTIERCDSVFRLADGKSEESVPSEPAAGAQPTPPVSRREKVKLTDFQIQPYQNGSTGTKAPSQHAVNGHKEPKKPTFLIVGSTKCGTTALASILGAHPDCCMSRPKEVNFFDNPVAADHDSNYAKGWEWYREAFSHYNGEPVVGEATPSYADRTRGSATPARIRGFNRRMKLIYMVRDPLERQISLWKMIYALGVIQTTMGTEREPWQVRAFNGFDQWMRVERENRLWDACRYEYQLEGLLEHFPGDQILVSFLEDWKSAKDAEVERIMTFLGLDPAKRDKTFLEISNKADDRRLERPFIKRIRMRPGVGAVIRRFPPSWRDWARNNIATRRIVAPAIDLSDELRAEFARFVSADARRFLRRFGKPADFWNSTRVNKDGGVCA